VITGELLDLVKNTILSELLLGWREDSGADSEGLDEARVPMGYSTNFYTFLTVI
jgi:hypothetical protein